MPQNINISDQDIEYAEKILLPEGKVFDQERRDFIRCLKTIDLQAVPGSGKTTALLAKLLILERYMPFQDGHGVLVISHTNAAVDEIKERIGKHCPQLFSYPNFVGTIQSFVNRFLAVPFYMNSLKERPLRIDANLYNERLSEIINNPWAYKFGLSNENFNKVYRFIKRSERMFYKYRFGIDKDKIILKESLNGTQVQIKDKKNILTWLRKLKIHILCTEKILHYDDAYFLANRYIKKNPTITTLLQKRFKYVLVDEMQDMDIHQYNLIETIFKPDESTQSVVQRIGDKNQAIFNSDSSPTKDIWTQRKVMYLNGSHRLSSKIADLVQKFALTGNPITGNNPIEIKPIIFIYTDDTIELVIPKYADKIKELQKGGLIPESPRHKFTAIAWRKGQNTSAKDSRITLSTYWPHFKKSKPKEQIDFKVLEDYILYINKDVKTLRPIQNNIINLLLEILHIEKISHKKNNYYSKKRLLNFLKLRENNDYEELKSKLYEWSMGCIKEKKLDVIKNIKDYIPTFLSFFDREINLSTQFILGKSEISLASNENENDLEMNIFNSEGIKIEIGSVHSVKGQTHTATLYLETYFYKDGGKSYESQRLAGQFLGTPITKSAGKRVKQSAKMVYVGFSRPTHLLGIAIHQDRYKSYLSQIDGNCWDIVKVWGN